MNHEEIKEEVKYRHFLICPIFSVLCDHRDSVVKILYYCGPKLKRGIIPLSGAEKMKDIHLLAGYSIPRSSILRIGLEFDPLSLPQAGRGQKNSRLMAVHV